jgi:hypothetical protein
MDYRMGINQRLLYGSFSPIGIIYGPRNPRMEQEWLCFPLFPVSHWRTFCFHPHKHIPGMCLPFFPTVSLQHLNVRGAWNPSQCFLKTRHPFYINRSKTMVCHMAMSSTTTHHTVQRGWLDNSVGMALKGVNKVPVQDDTLQGFSSINEPMPITWRYLPDREYT